VKLMAMQAKIDTLSRARKGGGEIAAKNEGTKKNFKTPLIPDPGWLTNQTALEPIDLMTLRGKKWHYCCQENGGKCGGKWRVHKPSECKGTAALRKRGKEKQGSQGDTDEGGSSEDSNDVKRLKIMTALTEAMNGVDFEE
jgi:hypothetical protein